MSLELSFCIIVLEETKTTTKKEREHVLLSFFPSFVAIRLLLSAAWGAFSVHMVGLFLTP